MDKLERAHRLHICLNVRRSPLPLTEIMAMFGHCSASTAKRSIRDLKYLGAPIYCVEGQGYRYDKHRAFELPGIWFSPEELHALLTIQQLTTRLSGGLFDHSAALIRDKANALLGKYMPSPQEMQRIRILAAGSRSRDMPMFSQLTTALLERQRLHICYHGRQRGERTEREVSPQRLVYYRANWYLDCWCHSAGALRSFAVERIQQAKQLDAPCKTVAESLLEAQLTRSFGIFSGEPTATAVLRFTAFAARWVRDEEWFPGQQSHELADSRLELRIPYNNPTELIMEICRHGPEVEVIAPPELRQQVADQLQQAADQYR